jgi:hypothetical protein
MSNEIRGDDVENVQRQSVSVARKAHDLAPDDVPDVSAGLTGKSRMEDETQGGEYIELKPQPSADVGQVAHGNLDEDADAIAPGLRGDRTIAAEDDPDEG